MRNELVAAIVGVVVGHALWLIAISLAIDTTTISSWVLIVAAASVLLGVIGIVLGLRHYRRKSYVWAAFLWCLPLSPAVFSLAVLGVTYL